MCSSEPHAQADGQGTPRMLWKPKVRYCVHKSLPPLGYILRQNNSAYVITPYYNTTVTSRLHSDLPCGLLPLKFLNNFLCILIAHMCATCPAYITYFYI
jgi:hypothetical protein